MPSTPCLHAGCGELATRLGRCASHAASYDHAIPRAGRALYKTKRWQVLRRSILFDEPLCRTCSTEGVDTIANEVDHIIPIADGGDEWSRSNLQPLCPSHHARKTKLEVLSR